MVVIKQPEDGKKFLEYTQDGCYLSFGDDELTVNIKKRERDNKVILDVCRDWLGGLTIGTGGAKVYEAQIIIPARTYIERPKENDEFELEPVPLDMDKVTLVLYEEVI